MTSSRAARQRFSIGYHLNSWDLTGQPLRPALEFLKEQGFGWFEILAFTSLSDQFARKYMQLGHQGPMGVTTDTDILRRYAHPVGGAKRTRHQPVVVLRQRDFHQPGVVAGGARRARFSRAAAQGLRLHRCSCSAAARRWRPATGTRRTTTGRSAARSKISAQRTADLGIVTVYHPHLDTFIEQREQLDHMMDELDTSKAGLCIDPAHLAQTDSDPVDALKTYISAIRYMHLKDTRVDPSLEGYDRYAAFCELGAGVVDLAGLVDVLLDADYDGLAIVELDASQKTAEQSTIESIAYLRDTLGLELNPIKSA